MLRLPFAYVNCHLVLRQQWWVFLLSVLLPGFAPFYVFGQKASTFSVRYLGLKEGLSSRDVNDIYQDRRGVIWIATPNGLNRYDGAHFKAYSTLSSNSLKLPSSRVWSVAEDEAQNLLICTDAGLVGFDRSRRRLLSLRESGFPDSITKQANCRIDRLPNGKLMLLAGAGIYLYEGGRLKEWFRVPSKYVRNIKNLSYSNKDSTLYLETNNEDLGLLAIRNKRLEVLNFLIYNSNSIPQSMNTLGRQAYLMLNTGGDSTTLVWILSKHMCLTIDRKSKRFEYAEPEELSDVFPPWKALEDCLDKKEDPALPESLRTAYLKSCFIDDQGVYWLGTDSGVFMVRQLPELSFRQFDFLKNQSVRFITQDAESNFLIGTYSGLFKYNAKKNHLATMPDVKPVLGMVPAGNHRYWMSLERHNGLHFFDNQKLEVRQFYPHLLNLSYVCDFALSDSVVWMARNVDTIYSINLSDGRIMSQSTLKPYTSSIPHLGMKTILRAKDASLWLASEGGLYRLIPDAKRGMKQDEKSVPDALKSIKVNALYEDAAGRMWMGTDGQGLAVLSPDTGKLRWYTSDDGLAHHVVYAILGSHHDSLIWIGTQHGLSCLDTKTDVFSNYYQEDGLADNEFNSGAAYASPDGTLYFGGLSGITYFNPTRWNFKAHPIKAFVNIEVLTPGGLEPEECWFPVNQETVSIPSSETYFEIRFLASDMLSVSKIRYRYKITGLYDEWQYLDAATNKLVIRNLHPGQYKLKVQAMSTRGQWSESYCLTIKILPHYYQTWWFRFLMGVCILGLLYGLYQFRIFQIRKEYQMRSQIVNDLHDDLGGRLYAMRAIASKIASPQTRATSINTLLEQFETISKNAYAAMRDFIWAFDPQSDHLQKLVERMSDFAKQTIQPLVPALQISDNLSLKETSIPPVVKHHVLMVFQEVLINATKHTLSSSLTIHFSTPGQQLRICILNKHGGLRKSNTDQHHKGGESIQARLAAVKGQLEWKELEDTQEIILTFPL